MNREEIADEFPKIEGSFCKRGAVAGHVSIVKWSVVMDQAWTGTVVMFYGLWWRWTDYDA